jgi:hypothetical protein
VPYEKMYWTTVYNYVTKESTRKLLTLDEIQDLLHDDDLHVEIEEW